ncbi:MAG: type IIA DNA topoisomerase subunit B [Clostridia bacterium]|nr:type IIA DNA topoisomerase subunit B [Clostridia bacterium]
MAKNTYKAEDIKILEGLDAVRMRPGMYIGTTSVRGLHHILWEIVDNAVDEAANGYCDRIEVKLYNDGSASVEDNGRGIPVDIHKKAGVTGVQVVFTQLHAGGKFGSENYSYSGGLHGVGASVTNALSEWLKVQVYKGTIYEMEFRSEKDEKTGKIKSGVPVAPLKDTKVKTNKKGTFVRFKPDATVFETVEFSVETILKRLKELAFLNKGLEIDFYDEHTDFHRIYKYDGGLIDFVKYLNEGKSTLYYQPLYAKAEKDGVLVEFAIQHTDAYVDSLYSYVNNIPTPEGGMHETGFRSGITRVFNDYAREKNYLKDKDDNFTGDDFKEGLTAIISVKMQNVQFEGQTKTKLGNPEARPAVENVTINALSDLMKNKKLSKVFEAILDKAASAAKVRLAAKKAKEIARASKSIESKNLVGKLAACSGRKPEMNELFIVEGDSAGGSAKQARVRQYQAILPLRGKPLNVEKKKIDQILLNEEIATIISALGTGIGSEFDLSSLKYHKVIILSDADVDGSHIRILLLTFFFRYMRDLINEGHVYIGMPPLYRATKNNKSVRYLYTDKELQNHLAEVGKCEIQRYKGLGEMDAEQLWETTMDPEKRNLMRVTIDDAAEADRLITVLMGDEVAARKQYIFDNSDFDKEDKFSKMKRS